MRNWTRLTNNIRTRAQWGRCWWARGVTTIAGASLTSEARKWRRRLRRRTDLERPPPTFSSMTVGGDIISAASGVSLQKARSWDEGVASNFSSTPLRDIFKAPISHLFCFTFVFFMLLHFFFLVEYELNYLGMGCVVCCRIRKSSSLAFL